MPFVRGNKIVVVYEPYTYFPSAPPPPLKIGDILTVSSHRGSGWLRAHNNRTQDVITLRVGPHIAFAGGGRKERLERLAAYAQQAEQQRKKVCLGSPSSTSLTESLAERRGFKSLVCEIAGAPKEEVKKVPEDIVVVDLKAAKKTIADLKQEIEKLREQNKALLHWRNKHLESTPNDAWELVYGEEMGRCCDE